MITEPELTKIKIKTKHDIDATGEPDVAVDRYLIDSAESSGLISRGRARAGTSGAGRAGPPAQPGRRVHPGARGSAGHRPGRCRGFRGAAASLSSNRVITGTPSGTAGTSGSGCWSSLRLVAWRNCSADLPSRAASTTLRHCRSWPRSTAARSISSAPCRWSNATGWSSKPCPLAPRRPEELETLLEDACLVGDLDAMADSVRRRRRPRACGSESAGDRTWCRHRVDQRPARRRCELSGSTVSRRPEWLIGVDHQWLRRCTSSAATTPDGTT